MSKRPHDVTVQAVIEFNRNMLKDLASYYGGRCTLNELRVMNQAILCSHLGRTCSVTALHKATGIPIPTVSRAVTNLQKDRWLSDRRDPTDGRKRIISLGPRSVSGTWKAIDKKVQWDVSSTWSRVATSVSLGSPITWRAPCGMITRSPWSSRTGSSVPSTCTQQRPRWA